MSLLDNMKLCTYFYTQSQRFHTLWQLDNEYGVSNDRDTDVLWEATRRNWKHAVNISSVIRHRGTNCRRPDYETEAQVTVLHTISTPIRQMWHMLFLFRNIPTDSSKEYNPLFHKIQIDVHFLFVQDFRFAPCLTPPLILPVNRNLHQKYFHLHYKQATIGVYVLAFLFTQFFKTVGHASFHHAPYIECDMVISSLIKLHLFSYPLHES
jgi:hypothetical protein